MQTANTAEPLAFDVTRLALINRALLRHVEEAKTAALRNLDTPLSTLLADHPALMIDREIAAAVCEMKCFPRREEIPNLPAGTTVADFLTRFRHESTRQEFMAFYVEVWKRYHPPLSAEEAEHLKRGTL